jgi:hypothetical protein
VDGTGSGSCPVAGCGVSCIEASVSATRVSYVILRMSLQQNQYGLKRK